MALDELLTSWNEVRSGLILEAEQIPEEHFSFRPTDETRSVAEILQHIVETQKFLVGEACRRDASMIRQSFADQIKEHAPGVSAVKDKNGLLELLRSSMESAEESLRSHSDLLKETLIGLDGKPKAKLGVLNFIVGHEMYHRGQLTVYERLLGIEPQLTQRFKKIFARSAAG
jgi:uncharacterized damage-inducible protein DinB